MPIAYVLKADNATYGKVDEHTVDWDRNFSYELRIYNTSGTKVAEIVGDIEHTTLSALEFELLQNGGCGAFSFTLADEYTDATIDYNYRVEMSFYTQPNRWFSGLITEVPKKGTDTTWKYSGYGYFKQLEFIRINTSHTAQEISATATAILDLVTPDTDIVKDTDKIEDTGYTTAATLKWERIKARSCFKTLAELATDYEFGVDEERDFYFRAISTTVLEKFWIGKHLTAFDPKENQDNLCNRLYIRCGRLTDGTDYVLYRENAASQSTYGLREDVVRAPEFFPIFSTTNIASGQSVSVSPTGTGSANLVDDDYSTLWASGTAQVSGHYIEVDLGSSYTGIAKVVLDSIHADAQEYYARGFSIKISTTGSFAGEETTVYTTTENSNWKPIITFTPTTGRYVRLTLTAGDSNEWKVGEFEVYELDTADVERWGDYILSERKDIKKTAVAVIKGIDKIINEKQTIAPIKPRGKIGIYGEDGTHIDDYSVKACKYYLDSNGFNLKIELGELEISLSTEIRKMLQQLKEHDLSGVRNTADLAGGIGAQPGTITRTMIGKDTIEVPMLRGEKISLYGGLVEMGKGVMSGGGHGFVVSDGTYYRIEVGKIDSDYGVNIRDSSGNLTVELGEVYVRQDQQNLIVKLNTSNPTYQVDIDADLLCLGEYSKVLTSINLTVDITASGVNGLDTGSEAANTWYSIWVIYKPATNTIAGLLSTSEASPTMPSGYTKKRMVGHVRNNAASNFSIIENFGDDFHDRGDPSPDADDFGLGDFNTDGNWHDMDLSPYIPPGAKLSLFLIYIEDALTQSWLEFRRKGSTTEKNVSSVTTQVANTLHRSDGIVPLDENRKIQYHGINRGFTNIVVQVRGWWR